MVSSSWQHSLAGDPGDGVALLPGATGLFPLLRGRVLLGFALSHAHFQIAPFCAQELPTGHTQCLELFAGVAVIASAWRKAGYSSRALDLDRTWSAFKCILASQTFKFRHSLIEAAMRLLIIFLHHVVFVLLQLESCCLQVAETEDVFLLVHICLWRIPIGHHFFCVYAAAMMLLQDPWPNGAILWA